MFLLLINSVIIADVFFCLICSYHCFHFAPVVRLEVWKHDWVTPRPKCHAGEENRRMMNISYRLFVLFKEVTTFTRLLQNNSTCMRDTELLTSLPWNDSSPMFFSFPLPAWLLQLQLTQALTHKDGLCYSVAKQPIWQQSPCCGKLEQVIISDFDIWPGTDILVCVCEIIQSGLYSHVKLFSLYQTWYITDETFLHIGRITNNDAAVRI